MNPDKIEEGLRLIGRGNAHYRIGRMVQVRSGDGRHPLALAHARAGHKAIVRGKVEIVDALGFMEAFQTGIVREPAEWRRDGERAARQFGLGVMMAEALEARAERSRIARETDVSLSAVPRLPVEFEWARAINREAGAA